MATLVLSSLGTALGGPLGGAVGALIGGQLDRAVIGGPKREGPRLKELAVTTSSYGTAIPRHFGRVRAAGSVIWATDLVESSEKHGGAKGSPSTVTYSYSASFAVALASRPIRRLGRIWADGNLLRGEAGDLKVGGELRVYTGHGDQPSDPLIATERGGACPAFRGLAYCVFEALQLGDFGNRIPTLSFEVIADDGEVSLAQVVEPLGPGVRAWADLPGLLGFSDEGGPIGGCVDTLAELYPITCDTAGEALALTSPESSPASPTTLPAPVIDAGGDGFGGAAGRTYRRRALSPNRPAGVRYYDPARDFQASVQRVIGRAGEGQLHIIEFPGTLAADTARALANAASERMKRLEETLTWRIAELDARISPGSVVKAPGYSGLWRVAAWEWRDNGLELELHRMPETAAGPAAAFAGISMPKPDLVATPTTLVAYELPWDGLGPGNLPQTYAAASSTTSGWTGAALYVDRTGELIPAGTASRRRCTTGHLAAPLTTSPALLLEPQACAEIQLVAADLHLDSTDAAGLAQGANRALVGDEIIQFAQATAIAPGTWRVTGLLRGRGGTEAAAARGHAPGTPLVLLDGTPTALDLQATATTQTLSVAAIGLADPDPVLAAVTNSGVTLRPLSPVRPRAELSVDGALHLGWSRRARGAWTWPATGEVPLIEEAEAYLVGIGDAEAPVLSWELTGPSLTLDAATFAELSVTFAGAPLWVRQVGTFARSEPLLLMTLS